MMAELLEDPFVCLEWITRLHGFGVVLMTFERLAHWREYAEAGRRSWSVASAGRKRLPKIPGANWLFGFPIFPYLLLIRTLAGATLMFTVHRSPASVIAVVLVFVSMIAMDLRESWFVDSISSRLQAMISTVLCLQLLAVDSHKVAVGMVGFIAVNTSLSYLLSAISKLSDVDWRNGSKVYHVLQGRFHGSEGLAGYLSGRSFLTRVMTWGVLGFEFVFPLVLFLDWPACMPLLVGGLSFHLMNRLLLGIPGFTLVYLSAYPAIVYVSRLLASSWR